MFCLLSPAKTLCLDGQFQSKAVFKSTLPLLNTSAEFLANALKTTKPHIASDEIRSHFRDDFSARPLIPGGLMYDGPAFKKLSVCSLIEADVGYAQDHMVVLSGMYGAVRPLDSVRPYRLEMGSKVTTEHGTKLAQYWTSEGLSQSLNKLVKNSDAKFVLNCASQEYAGAIDWGAVVDNTSAIVVHVVFQASSGRLPSVYAKQARGELVRFAITSRAETIDDLSKFTGADDNFTFSKSAEANQVVFVRTAGPVAAKAKPKAKPKVIKTKTTPVQVKKKSNETVSKKTEEETKKTIAKGKKRARASVDVGSDDATAPRRSTRLKKE